MVSDLEFTNSSAIASHSTPSNPASFAFLAAFRKRAINVSGSSTSVGCRVPREKTAYRIPETAHCNVTRRTREKSKFTPARRYRAGCIHRDTGSLLLWHVRVRNTSHLDHHQLTHYSFAVQITHRAIIGQQLIRQQSVPHR